MSYVECLVLGLLHEGYRYGHELDKVLEKRKMRYWTKITRASIYQALDRLTTKGWVQTACEKAGKMPERTVYALTPSGEAAMRQMIFAGLGSQQLVTFEYCIPIALLDRIPKEQALSQLNKRKQFLLNLLGHIPSASADQTAEDCFGKRANLRLIKAYYQTELDWIEWLIGEVEKDQTDGGRDKYADERK